jgi:hypothetical protein
MLANPYPHLAALVVAAPAKNAPVGPQAGRATELKSKNRSGQQQRLLGQPGFRQPLRTSSRQARRFTAAHAHL